jgi:HAD superfamily hydrolase (TIGR01509 family)
MIRHLLFDNDGTLADTEIIAVRAFLHLLRPYQFQMDTGEFSKRYTGLLEDDILQSLRREFGLTVAADFKEQLHQAHREGFERELRAIPGMTTVFRNRKVPKSMVSNARTHHIEYCLRRMRLRKALDGHIFSAEHASHPKPSPAVYEMALNALNLRPHEVLAIEDSVAGVRAAAAAGIEVIGFLGAAHSYDGHREQLLAAGARHIAPQARHVESFLQERGV